MDLNPPPTDETYFSLDSLVKAVNDYAGPQGYAVIKQRTKTNTKGVVRKAVLGCDRGGKYKAEGFGKREHPTSRKIDCKFQAIATLHKEDDMWHLIMKEPSHNHTATLTISHSILRKSAMTQEIQKSIETQSSLNVAPQKIISGLRIGGDDENPIFLIKDIYNAKATIKRKKLGSLTPIQALFQNLNRDDWFYNHETNEHDQLKSLFFSKGSSHNLLKENWEVLLMDCTYKTNKYKMPLCIITGVTALNTTFYIGFCFMSEEHSNDYLWLLQQIALLYLQVDVPHPKVIITDGEKALIGNIHRVFPRTENLLCIWHINKNVVKNCKKSFETEEIWTKFYGEWQMIIHSFTEEAFNTNWDAFHATWIEYIDCLEYLSDLLFKYHYRRKFVSCWTDKILHFGNTATSRVEGAHWALKRNLLSSIGDLKTVVDAIDILLSNQRQEYLAAINQAKSRCPIELRAPWLQNVIPYVTPYALRKILEHWKSITQKQEDGIDIPCTKTFSTIMGLPCGHEIIELLKSDPPGMIDLEDINSHWRFVKPPITAKGLNGNPDQVMDPLLQITDPVVVRTKGRPVGSGNKRKADAHARSTHRDPSGFEYAEEAFEATQRNATQEDSTQSSISRPRKRRQRGRPRVVQDEELEGDEMMKEGG